MNNIWFTADEHYDHENARTGWGNPDKARPWDTKEEMTDGLIARHNERVDHGDSVFHLGDMFWRTLDPFMAQYIISRLNGIHYYVLGNHEEMLEHRLVSAMFGFVKERHTLKLSGYPPIVLDHYAGRVWNGMHRGSWQLYGHSHGMLEELPELRAFDVGVDANNYYPVSIAEVAERMAKKGAAQQ
jgi:calcineurin-like phosphoesterase family protein